MVATFPIVIEDMTADDIPAVQLVENASFPVPWPANAFKHEQTDLYPGMSVHDCYNEGPTFGAGFDFYTNLSTDASVSLGNSFACPGDDFDQCSRDFAGRLKPMMIELEVYSAQ